MNCSTIRSHLGQVQDSFISFVHRFGISCTSQRCQVHPEIGSNQGLDFINLGSKRIVRVVHISPKTFSRQYKSYASKVREKNDEDKDTSLPLDISSEEYWFTRTNRPYKLCDDCSRNPYPCKNNNLAEIHANFESDFNTNDNQMTVRNGDSLGIVSKSSLKLIDSFAEILSREVIDEVYRCMVNNFPIGNCSTTKHSNSGNILTFHSHSDSGLIDNCTVNNEPNRNAEIVTIHLNTYKDSTGVPIPERPYHNPDDKIRDTSFGNHSSGFINLSFSGSLSEPDEITSSYNDFHKVFETSTISSQPMQYKFETSNSFKGRLTDSDARVKFLLESGTPHEFEEKSEEEAQCCTDELPFSKENIGSESMTQTHTDDSINVNKTESLNVHGLKNQVHHDNGSVNQESCVHTKNTQKPLLLFLHGVGSSADVWSVVLEYFSTAGYEVLAPDMLGHGYSSAPNKRAAYTFEKLLQDVLQIFDRFVSDNQKCVAIGHSYGSCFAAALARYRPQQISQLVLLSGGGPSPLVPKQTLFSLHPCVVSLMKPFLMCGFKRDVFYAPRGKHLPSFCTYELPPYVMKFVERGQDWSDGDSAFHRRILVPTLLVHGLKDPHISLVEECEMERTIPRSFLEVLPNAGHMQMLDAPEQLCHMIHCFITWWNS